VTSAGIEALGKHEFVQLGLASLPNLKSEDFKYVIEPSTDKLASLNISFNASKEVNNALMIKVGMCLGLESLVLTGCEFISDEGMNNLIYGDKTKGKPLEGFEHLSTLKLGGLTNVSDQLYQLLKRCPALSFVECNNLERLSDHFLDQIKNLPHIKIIHINFTPNISDEKLKEIRETNKNITIVRNIAKMTDPADDGLRMPIPLASMKIKKPKKKKK
jgi:F-box and leucine-rich repeat protein 2/20